MLAPRHETNRANDRLKIFFVKMTLPSRKFDLNLALKTVYMRGLIVEEM